MTIAKAWPLAGCIVLIGCSPESRSASLARSSALEGKRAAHGASVEHVVLLSIDGFRRNLSQVASFRFGAVADSYAARTGGDQNVGVIGFAFFDERSDETARRLEAQPFSDARFAQPPNP